MYRYSRAKFKCEFKQTVCCDCCQPGQTAKYENKNKQVPARNIFFDFLHVRRSDLRVIYNKWRVAAIIPPRLHSSRKTQPMQQHKEQHTDRTSKAADSSAEQTARNIQKRTSTIVHTATGRSWHRVGNTIHRRACELPMQFRTQCAGQMQCAHSHTRTFASASELQRNAGKLNTFCAKPRTRHVRAHIECTMTSRKFRPFLPYVPGSEAPARCIIQH